MKKDKAKDAKKEAPKGLFNFGGKHTVSGIALFEVTSTRLSCAAPGMTCAVLRLSPPH